MLLAVMFQRCKSVNYFRFRWLFPVVGRWYNGLGTLSSIWQWSKT